MTHSELELFSQKEENNRRSWGSVLKNVSLVEEIQILCSIIVIHSIISFAIEKVKKSQSGNASETIRKCFLAYFI